MLTTNKSWTSIYFFNFRDFLIWSTCRFYNVSTLWCQWHTNLCRAALIRTSIFYSFDFISNTTYLDTTGYCVAENLAIFKTEIVNQTLKYSLPLQEHFVHLFLFHDSFSYLTMFESLHILQFSTGWQLPLIRT